MIKVSVVIPVYGVERYIERCARSLFEQTLDEIEFIFVNDCTRDRSMEVLNDIIKEYPNRIKNIKIIEHETNQGLPIARHTGLQVATGEYIAHCDSDDWVDINMYKLLYEKAKTDRSECVVCDFLFTDGGYNERILKSCHSLNLDKFIEYNLIQKDPWSLCNKLFASKVYKRSEITYPKRGMGEDMVLTIQLLNNITSLSYVDSPLYFYYENPQSMTREITREASLNSFNQVRENVEIVINYLTRINKQSQYKNAIAYLKYMVVTILNPVLYYDDILKIWKTTYRNLWKDILPNDYINLSRKVKFFCAYFGLYKIKSLSLKYD